MMTTLLAFTMAVLGLALFLTLWKFIDWFDQIINE